MGWTPNVPPKISGGEIRPPGPQRGMTSPTKRTPSGPLGVLVEEIVDIGGTLSQIAAHMAEFRASGRSSPDAPPIEVVLRSLLEGVLAPLAEQNAPDAIAEAAGILTAAHELICSEILLVPPDLDENDDELWAETG
jgi:hypothetical protein